MLEDVNINYKTSNREPVIKRSNKTIWEQVTRECNRGYTEKIIKSKKIKK